MEKILTIIVLLVAGNLGLAQNSKNILGKWTYVDLYDKSYIDETGQQMAGGDAQKARIGNIQVRKFSAGNTTSL